MSATPGTKLAQEIHDEFLVCKICLEAYKSPKSLNCLHTFCEQCIENHILSESTYKKYTDYREFTCPLCRKRTQLPIGGVKKLPDNFLVSSLSEIVQRQKPSKFPFCDICKMVNRKHKEAQSKCLDCAKLLCKDCVSMHKETKVTAGHSLFDIEIEKDIECKEHKDEVVRFYCEPCETCICVLCTFNEHKDHEITQFGDAVVKYKENITNLLEACKQKIFKFDSQMESLNKCHQIIKDVEQSIHDMAIQYIQEIRNQEKQLILELENIYGKDCMEYINNKKDLTIQVESLRSTCNLTEVILKGKDIELLLLKKDVQDKLSTLNEFTVQELPATINKVVNYVVGKVEFGYIHDLDRPLLTRRSPKNSRIGVMMSTRESQTDTDMTKLKAPTPRTMKSALSESESSDDSDSDSESDSESEDENPEMEDIAIQTDDQGTEKTNENLADHSTMTDVVPRVDIGVNTRSRSLMHIAGPGNYPPAQNGEQQGQPNQQTAPQQQNVQPNPGKPIPASEDGTENSLAARRRRRRERGAVSSNLGTVY